ncbi:MAG TPA: YggT family protein [Blastocatellia bacterium]|nr:YggT family protein [Blastocatellia bacterium]
MNVLVEALYWISVVIFWATIGFSALFFLRVLLAWLGVNPFGRIPYHLTRITEPMVRPIRYQFRGGYTRFDLIPLLIGVMILVTGLFIYSIIGQLAGILAEIDLNARHGTLATRLLVAELINLVGLLYIVAIFLRFFLPFFGVGYNNKFMRFLFVITEPLLKPLRRLFVVRMFDFSPLIAMLIVQLVIGFVSRAVAGV